MAIYLDYNASAPLRKEVLNVMIDAYTNIIGNADSRTHSYGTTAQKYVLEKRQQIASVLNIDPTELIFTSGSTESNNMAILGISRWAKACGKTHIITTSMEHKAILEPLRHLEQEGFTVDYVNPDSTGRVSVESIISRIQENTALVSVMYVNSETGIIQPVQELGEILKEKKVYFHIDATQALGKLNEQIRHTKYNMMSMTAHKIGGPQGIGAFILKRGEDFKRPPIEPLMYGGPQERGYRPGTTPIALIAGFAEAVRLSEAEHDTMMRKCSAIKENFMHAIQGLDYQINGDPAYCLPTTINISFSGLDAEAAFLCLGDDFAFSNGSACNSAGHKLSYVLEAMGLDPKRRSEAIRLSWDGSTDIDFSKFVEVIRQIIVSASRNSVLVKPGLQVRE